MGLDKGFIEIYPPYSNIRYFQSEELGNLVELHMDEDYIRPQIEIMCPLLGIDLAEFDKLYRRQKQHTIRSKS